MERLDARLARSHPEYSRSVWQKLIQDGAVQVNGKMIAKSSLAVPENADVTVDEKKIAALNKPISFNIPFSDLPMLLLSRTFVVFDKPAGIRTEEVVKNLFSVHRLDKGTSGVLVAAKTLPAQGNLQKQWAARKVKKTYVALVRGRLEPRQGAIEAAIKRHHQNRQKMAVSKGASARLAVTAYKVKKYFSPKKLGETLTLVHAYPRTGRTHQIRVHFASIGLPVVGDSVYGNFGFNQKMREQFGLDRQFLHASELRFKSPDTKKNVTLRSKLPGDLESVLHVLS